MVPSAVAPAVSVIVVIVARPPIRRWGAVPRGRARPVRIARRSGVVVVVPVAVVVRVLVVLVTVVVPVVVLLPGLTVLRSGMPAGMWAVLAAGDLLLRLALH